MKLKNPRQTKDKASGKFQKVKASVPVEKEETHSEYIQIVKNEILNGYYDLERIKKAYLLIVRTDNYANIIAMRRTIIGYEQ